ncbi:hypothetical protein YM3MPS_39130 [Mycobacterium pseudoshottsii]|nr:Butyryl-CoA dehydrogenase [Mycobacterium sp. 012931]MBC9861440.1 Butyryl-CoA dehydrogenase [Mycobacterium pseudoshottsii]BEH78110.1 hypothetical protein YM3MPS_39130 [Mycobacterium pseudoshottsii]
MNRFELRRLDYSLSEDHLALQSAYRQFLATHCPIETVRAAEPSGFDKNLWERLCAMGATTMAVPESAGGDGATLVDPTLVAEEIGRALAPVPWIDHVCAARLLARFGTPDAETAAVTEGKRVAGLDARIDSGYGTRLIPTGSIADHIVVRDGDAIVLLSFSSRPARVDNIGRLPMAWIDPGTADLRRVLAQGPDALANYQRVLDEWRLLSAAALVGLVEATMEIAAEFAKTRYTLGVPISTLQAISHPLANMAITVQGAATWLGARPGSWTTNPKRGRSWGSRRSSSWPKRPRRRPPWRCTSKAAWVFRRRPLRPHIWYGPGDGHWPVVIRASPPAESPRSWPAARVRNRPRESRTGVGDGFLPSADFRRGPRVSGNGA